MNYLVSVVEIWRVPDDAAADAMEELFRADETYVLSKWSKEDKVRKSNGEVVDEWVQVKTMKVFNDPKEPDSDVQPTYR